MKGTDIYFQSTVRFVFQCWHLRARTKMVEDGKEEAEVFHVEQTELLYSRVHGSYPPNPRLKRVRCTNLVK